MKRLKQWLSFGPRQRQEWLKRLTWGRLRYVDAGQATRALILLSSQTETGRIELSYLPGEVPQLHLGLSAEAASRAKRILADHGCCWQPTTPPKGTDRLFCKANRWPDEVGSESLGIMLVDGYLFTSADSTGKPKPVSHPEAPRQQNGSASVRPSADWRLPEPTLGLSATVDWTACQAPEPLIVTRNSAEQWMLGRSTTGVVGIDGNVNLVGDEEACGHYLVQIVLQALAASRERLVVIDGCGDLVRMLKRKSLVTDHIGRGITLTEMDGPTATGFDPLAVVGPGGSETEAQQLGRWRLWFTQLGVTPEGLSLIEEAHGQGYRDWQAVSKWILGNQKGSFLAQSSLRSMTERLTAPELGDSALQPLPYEGALLFSCSDTSINRHHYLTAILLAALNLPATRLVVYGYNWRGFDRTGLANRQRLILANGPRLPDSHLLLTQGKSSQVLLAQVPLAQRELGQLSPVNNLEWSERLQLLKVGEGLLFCRVAANPKSNSEMSQNPTYLHW